MHRRYLICDAADTPPQLEPGSDRRQFNQVFFRRLLIDDHYEVIGELEEPFETLLGDEIRQVATVRYELEQQRILDEGAAEGDTDDLSRSRLVLTGTAS